jgi:hypothetical protein
MALIINSRLDALACESAPQSQRDAQRNTPRQTPALPHVKLPPPLRDPQVGHLNAPPMPPRFNGGPQGHNRLYLVDSPPP